MAGTVSTSVPLEGVVQATWAALAGAENGAAAQMPDCPWKSVVVTGTGTVAMEGSNDGTTWVPLHDNQGVAISALGPGAAVIAENTRHIRPVSTGAASMTVSVVGIKRAEG